MNVLEGHPSIIADKIAGCGWKADRDGQNGLPIELLCPMFHMSQEYANLVWLSIELLGRVQGRRCLVVLLGVGRICPVLDVVIAARR